MGMLSKVIRLFASAKCMDLCVICSAVTLYDTSTKIEVRQNYIEGTGQLCFSCIKLTGQEKQAEPNY